MFSCSLLDSLSFKQVRGLELVPGSSVAVDSQFEKQERSLSVNQAVFGMKCS